MTNHSSPVASVESKLSHPSLLTDPRGEDCERCNQSEVSIVIVRTNHSTVLPSSIVWTSHGTVSYLRACSALARGVRVVAALLGLGLGHLPSPDIGHGGGCKNIFKIFFGNFKDIFGSLKNIFGNFKNIFGNLHNISGQFETK